MTDEVDEITIKCVRCPCELGFGQFAGPEAMSREEGAELVIERLGWHKTFAGWQCPDHRP